MKSRAGTPAELQQLLVDSGHWNDYAQSFCDQACLMRYLRARSFDVTKAAAMLRGTLEWRQQNDVDNLRRQDFEDTPFMREGWVYVGGNDSEGRSIVMFRKRKDKFPMHLQQVYMKYMTFVIESAIKNMKNGAEQWIWVLDLSVYSPSNAPHMSVTLGVLNMLANHYPERLHKAYVCNAPTIFSLAYKMIYPFVDPVSRSKAEFISTSAYEPAKPGREPSSSWFGSSGSSWFGSSKSSKACSKPAASTDGDNDADVDIVVEEEGQQQGNSSDFKHLLSFYNTPYELQRYQQLLIAAGL